MPDLRKGQYKRLGRIAENNPERAERVADRMEKRASREERGKAVAKSASEGNKGIRGKLVTAQRTAAENDKIRARYSRDEEKGTAGVIKRMTSRDYPLSPTPEPYGEMRGSRSEERGKINPINGKVSVDGVDVKDIKKYKSGAAPTIGTIIKNGKGN